jgi:hypothetical protein
MERRPQSYQALHRPGADISCHQLAIEIELSLLALIFGVEMWGFVVPVEHANNDAKEH